MKNENEGFNAQKIFTAILSIAIVAALVFGVVSIAQGNKSKEKDEQRLVDLNAENETEKNLEYVLNREEIKSTEENSTEIGTSEQETVEEIVVPQTEAASESTVNNSGSAQYIFSENDVLTWPVEGGIILNYSMDSTIWFPTMKQYKCNPGVVISATQGQEVVAAASGVVEKIEETAEYGTTILVDIGGGYKTLYGQVNNVKNLKEGSTVIAGEAIAEVNKTTRYFVTEGDNLFFEMTKEDEPVNPIEYLE